MRSPDSERGRLFECVFRCVRVFDAQPFPAPYRTIGGKADGSGVKLEVAQSPSSERGFSVIAIGEVVLYAAQQFSRPGSTLRS